MFARDVFFFLAGVIAASVLLPVVRSLIRPDASSGVPLSPRTVVGGAAVAVAALGAALGLYAWWGSPTSIGRSGPSLATGAMPPHPLAGTGASGAPGTMEEATGRLAARLARSGGTPAEWELLAKSYDFLGRAEDARQARARASAGTTSEGLPASSLGEASARESGAPAVRPLDPAARRDLAQAEKLRRTRDYAGADALYARLAGRGMLTAETWADYADTAASLNGGRLSGEPERYIDESLRLDPREPKALWLRASLAHEQHRELDALADWRELAARLPPDSPDQRIIAANIEEAQRLSAGAGGARAPGPTSVSSQAPGARIVGTVELAAALLRQAPAGATLFIYARNPGPGGPPLAVLRVRADHWPVSFVLDDGNSMIPGLSLSSAASVQLEARISRSGNALPQAGDLVGSAPHIDPHSGQPVHIAIDRTIS